MDRIALAAVATGLVLILGVCASVAGGAVQGEAAQLAALVAAASGGAIVSGLFMLERRTAGGPTRA